MTTTAERGVVLLIPGLDGQPDLLAAAAAHLLLAHLGWSPSWAFVHSYLGQPWPDLAAYRAKCRLVLETDVRPYLPLLRCPLLVVIGGFDPVVPTSAGLEVAALAGGQVAQSSPGETRERVNVRHADAPG